MKKLIINENNLLKISRNSDLNIKFRINKSLNFQESTLKKTPFLLLQNINICLETLEKILCKTDDLSDQKVVILIQLLKNYKEVLNSNHQSISLSQKLNKQKFKIISIIQDKQNKNLIPNLNLNGKQKIISQRTSKFNQNLQNIIKPKKFITNFCQQKKNLKQKSQKYSILRNQSNIFKSHKKQDDIKQSQKITDQSCKIKVEEQFVASQSVVIQQSSQLQKQTLCTPFQDNLLQIKINELNSHLLEKKKQLKQFQQRIEQLTVNIEDLIKKNSQKFQELNKLQNQNLQLIQKLNSQQTQQKYRQLQINFDTLSEKHSDLKKQITQLQTKLKILENQKNHSLEQEVSRYQTAQTFYELTRNDLREENEQLIILLEERQNQLKNLYQVVNHNE